MADRQTTVHLCVVACITGFKTPRLSGDFSHLMPDDGAKHAVADLRTQLHALDEEIAARNKKRALPLLTFMPERMAVSVAI